MYTMRYTRQSGTLHCRLSFNIKYFPQQRNVISNKSPNKQFFFLLRLRFCVTLCFPFFPTFLWKNFLFKKKHFSYFIHDDICKQITNAIISDVRRKEYLYTPVLRHKAYLEAFFERFSNE